MDLFAGARVQDCVGGVTELEEIKRDGGKAQKNSGRGKTQKGDAVIGSFLYDVKEYEKSFSVSQNVWAKVCTDAYTANNKIPAIKIVLGKANAKTRLWVIDDHTFHLMREAFEEKYG